MTFVAVKTTLVVGLPANNNILGCFYHDLLPESRSYGHGAYGFIKEMVHMITMLTSLAHIGKRG